MGDAAGGLQSLPGYDPDVQKNRTEARKIMQKLGHGPASGQTLHARYPSYRDPAVILLSQIKGALYRYRAPAGRHGAMVPQGHAQGLHRRSQCYRDRRRRPGSAVLPELCAARSATIPAIVALRSIKLVDQQSMQSDPEKRKKLVWEIKRRLAEDGARPVISYPRGGTCRQPYVKGADHHGQQHLQWVAHGRRLARQVAVLGLLAVAGC